MNEEEMAANATENTVDTEIANGEENVEFTDGSATTETVKDTSEIDKTKSFSERLKKERQKIEQEFASKKQAELDQIAVTRGFKDWKELDLYNKKDSIEAMGIKDAEKFDSYINEAIANSPTVVEAKRIIESQKEAEKERLVTEAITEINKLDPEIKSLDDITKMKNYDDFYGLVEKGYSLSDAYKIAAFDKITASKVAGAAQNVITNIDSKSHFKPLTGGAAKDVIVPPEILASYHKNMPNMSEQEIKDHYNKYMKEGN